MNKLEVGMYVRTKDGVIGKLQNKIYVGYGDFIIDTLYYNFDEIIDKWTCNIKKYDVKKASYNIIDLIEVGDYVNGYCVEAKQDKFLIIDSIDNWSWGEGVMPIEEIKSILTKEQFESMKYKLGDNNER